MKNGCVFGCVYYLCTHIILTNTIMKVIKRALTFNLHKRKGQENNTPIRLRVSYLGNRIDLLTGYSVAVNDWSNTKVKVGVINKRGVSADSINTNLNEMRSAIENVFKLAEL